MIINTINRVIILGVFVVSVLSYNSVNADYESATQGSLFTTRTWKRNNVAKTPEEFMEKVVNKGCANKYTTTCLKLDVVSFVDRLAAAENYQIVPGIVIVKENVSSQLPAEVAASLAKEHPNDIDARLDAFLMKRVTSYLSSHSINFKMFDKESFANARQFGEQNFGIGRKGGFGGGGGGGFGGGKDKGGYGMLLAAGMMMAGTLGPIMMGAIAMIAGKALMTGLLAMMLSAIVGLKGLGGGGSKGVHYEIIQKPVYSNSHTHSSEVQHVEHGHGGGHGGGGGGGGGGGHHESYGHSSYGRSFDTEEDVQITPSVLDAQRVIPLTLADRLRGGKSVDDDFVPSGSVLFAADAHKIQDVDVHEMAYGAQQPQS